MNYNDHQPTNDFLDSLTSNSFIPYILHSTRITSHSKTLIDNIFSNFISHEIISGNITATKSDHLPKFSFVPNILSNPSTQKSNFLKEIGLNLSKKALYLSILIKIGLTYFKLINKMLIFLWILSKQCELHLGYSCPLKKVNEYKLKFKSKPWITPPLQKFLSIINNFLKKFITAKDLQIKERYHKEYKDYRNLLSITVITGTASKIYGKA